jgi:putative SOS response-associated peptidase YedK
MTATEVSTAVNSVANDRPELLEPAAPAPENSE